MRLVLYKGRHSEVAVSDRVIKRLRRHRHKLTVEMIEPEGPHYLVFVSDGKGWAWEFPITPTIPEPLTWARKKVLRAAVTAALSGVPITKPIKATRPTKPKPVAKPKGPVKPLADVEELM